MSLILENARLTNDTSNDTYTVTISDGRVKSITPTSSSGSSTSSDTGSQANVERIDVQGDYVGEHHRVLDMSSLPLMERNINLADCMAPILPQPLAWSTIMSISAYGQEQEQEYRYQNAIP